MTVRLPNASVKSALNSIAMVDPLETNGAPLSWLKDPSNGLVELIHTPAVQLFVVLVPDIVGVIEAWSRGSPSRIPRPDPRMTVPLLVSGGRPPVGGAPEQLNNALLA